MVFSCLLSSCLFCSASFASACPPFMKTISMSSCKLHSVPSMKPSCSPEARSRPGIRHVRDTLYSWSCKHKTADCKSSQIVRKPQMVQIHQEACADFLGSRFQVPKWSEHQGGQVMRINKTILPHRLLLCHPQNLSLGSTAAHFLFCLLTSFHFRLVSR